MNISQLAKCYDFHDSFITDVCYDEANKILNLQIDLLLWMQKEYTADMPENGVLELTFIDVELFLCEDGDPCGEFVTILDIDFRENKLYIAMIDDLDNNYFEMCIQAESVNVKKKW